MNRIAAYFRLPAPVNRKPWLVVVTASLLVGFMLFLFQPFGLHRIGLPDRWLAIAAFTWVTAAATSFTGYVLPYLFRNFYKPANWTTGKRLCNDILLLLLIAFGNFLVHQTLGYGAPGVFWPVLRAYLLVTFLIGLIPMLVSFFIVENGMLKQNLADAQELNRRLVEQNGNRAEPDRVRPDSVLLAGNTKETLELCPADLLFAEADGNYVRVTWLSGTEVKRKQLRATIAQVENVLCVHPAVVRCHRAFIVNTSFVANVEGNSHGFRLTLHQVKEEIPVSRSYAGALRDSLNNL